MNVLAKLKIEHTPKKHPLPKTTVVDTHAYDVSILLYSTYIRDKITTLCIT